MGERIPDDVWKQAEAVLKTMHGPRCDDIDALEAAARAILAERERCAKLVEGLSWDIHLSPDHIRARRPADYARAIRGES